MDSALLGEFPCLNLNPLSAGIKNKKTKHIVASSGRD
jgi:hypothetical protein